MNQRIFVEKKLQYQTQAKCLMDDFNTNLGVNIFGLRIINIYDIFNIDKDLLEKSKYTIFGEKVTDNVFTSIELENELYFAIEFLPGQFDQRADSAMQCLRLIDSSTNAIVLSGQLIIVRGDISDLTQLKKYYINEVESREKNMDILELNQNVKMEEKLEIEGFLHFNDLKLKEFRLDLGLAMSFEDIKHVQKYFLTEERNPTITEIKMLDTYWSDHCRHTTFETELKKVDFSKDAYIEKTYTEYIKMRNFLGRKSKPITLMDMAKINALFERKTGNLADLEISDENNACSIYIDVDNDGVTEKWLLMFKNETHNHPTEIEPFGGASTCIGGAIRDPLSGRSYVYQAMRVTGAGNIKADIKDTLAGKLPQRVISKLAAKGYSSYGNQIGLATTYVKEIYHDGYVAKRMEIGAVVGAIKADLIRREKPEPGDIIILLGGKTGRDGIGGATGSSKVHNEKSIEVCSSEVQKGNAPEERKIQRLFRNPEVVKLIKKSNDFGAGGVSVAIGELADGLEIDLDKIPLKYLGLTPTEIAISESQERMSVVVDATDVDKFIFESQKENIETTVIAKVTDTNRLVMKYNGKTIVDLSRDFINTNGIRQSVNVEINPVDDLVDIFKREIKGETFTEKFVENLKDLNVASQKGLVELFDSTIGAGTVLMPFGGKYQNTETQVSVQKLPLMKGNTKTASILAYGFNPIISSWSQYHGAEYSVVECLSKIVAAGGDYSKVRFSFQEYFPRLGDNPKNWGKVVSALLGSIDILKQFSLASIGGKDSMSGTFKDINVPPTLVAFGVVTANTDNIISPEFKQEGNSIYYIKHDYLENKTPNVEQLKKTFSSITDEIKKGNIISAYTITAGGLAEAITKMSFGNKLGANITTHLDMFNYDYGSFVVEVKKKLNIENAHKIGTVIADKIIINKETFTIDEALKASFSTFDEIYPTVAKTIDMDMSIVKEYDGTFKPYKGNEKEVNVIIPVFPGTNCDYDTAKAFEEAGAIPRILVFKNTVQTDIDKSIIELKEAIDNSHILVISGGFSAGDEPDGSGKFIANILNNETIKKSILKLLARKGLILGICNGFQALLKAGLFNNFKVCDKSPTLFRNDINRHVSHIAHTKVTSNASPWLSSFKPGDTHYVAMSHGEGKFVISKEDAKKMFDKGLVAFQYVDLDNLPTMDQNYNLNGSYYAIEGIISEDGQILGKMGHSERKGNNVYKNIAGNKCQDIFINAVKYFKKN